MTDVKYGFSKLNGNNYEIWKYKMEMLLQREELWEAISQPKPSPVTEEWKKKDSKAKATIGLLVEDKQVIHIRNKETAKEAWDALSNYYAKSTLSSKVFILKKVCRMRLHEGGNMEEHLSTMMELVYQLTSLGEQLAEHLIVAFILCSLPESYNSLVTSLESRPECDITLDFVKEKLLQEYKRRVESQDQEKDQVLKARKTVVDGKRVCFYCNKKGHVKKDCYFYKNTLKKGNKGQYKAQNISENTQDNICENNFCFNVTDENLFNATSWYIDSGCTSHMTNNKSFFDYYIPNSNKEVVLANGKCIRVKGSGNGTLECIVNGKIIRILVKDVLYVPELENGLLSVRKLTDQGFSVDFTKEMCTVSKNNIIFAVAVLEANLYKLKCAEKSYSVWDSWSKTCIHGWHRRFGHRDPEIVRKMLTWLETSCMENCAQKLFCDSCIRGKMSKLSFPKKSENQSENILDLVHSDLCGPMQTVTPGNNRYILTLIDDYSRYTVIFLLKDKSEVKNKIKEYVRQVENQFKIKPKIIRSDRGREYVNNDLRQFLANEGIKLQLTAPYCPQQNGVSERKNRSLIEMSKCMLLDANLDKKYWGEAVTTANYLQNRLFTTSTGCIPYQRWFKKDPNLSHLKIFGCTAYALIPENNRRKLDDKAKKYIFVGYEENSKAYRLLDTNTNKIIISRDVKFIENFHDSFIEKRAEESIHQSPVPGANSEELLLPLEDNDIVLPKMSENQERERMEPPEEFFDKEPEAERREEVPVLRRSERHNMGKPPKRYEYSNLSDIPEWSEPKTFSDIFSREDEQFWKKAMEEEINAMMMTNTWTLTSLPEGKKAIGCKWVFKIKHNDKGKISKYKARIVAQGFTQKYGVDYDEVFAPVVKQSTLRLLLTIAWQENLIVKHFDVKTAFLNGTLTEEIYMKQPEGFAEPGKDSLVCKLNKSIYGLKQSARVWNLTIEKCLLEMGFKKGEADPCFYIRKGEHPVYLLIYVDDLLLACTEEGSINEIGEAINKQFKINSLGDIRTYVGVQIEKNEEGIYFIHQKMYIQRLLRKFNLEKAKFSKIPLDTGYYKAETEVKLNSNEKYRSAIGSLLYLAVNTRPDIAISVSILSRKICSPSDKDWREVKRIFKYLHGTEDLKLRLGNREEDNKCLKGYVDADWGGDRNDRKSNTGYLMLYEGSLITWKSKKQNCVSLSSTEAELVALSEACQEIEWLKKLFKDFYISINTTVLYEDNQSCLAMLTSDKINSRTKHIETKYFYAREMKKSGKIQFEYCPTNNMIADLLTKPLDSIKLQHLRKMMGLADFKN